VDGERCDQGVGSERYCDHTVVDRQRPQAEEYHEGSEVGCPSSRRYRGTVGGGLQEEGVLRVVRCVHRLPVHYQVLHRQGRPLEPRLGEVVEEPEGRQAVPVHGQGQRAFPQHHLPRLAARHAGGMDAGQQYLDDRLPQLRRRQVQQVKERRCVWKQGARHRCARRCLAVLPALETSGIRRLGV